MRAGPPGKADAFSRVRASSELSAAADGAAGVGNRGSVMPNGEDEDGRAKGTAEPGFAKGRAPGSMRSGVGGTMRVPIAKLRMTRPLPLAPPQNSRANCVTGDAARVSDGSCARVCSAGSWRRRSESERWQRMRACWLPAPHDRAVDASRRVADAVREVEVLVVGTSARRRVRRLQGHSSGRAHARARRELTNYSTRVLEYSSTRVLE